MPFIKLLPVAPAAHSFLLAGLTVSMVNWLTMPLVVKIIGPRFLPEASALMTLATSAGVLSILTLWLGAFATAQDLLQSFKTTRDP